MCETVKASLLRRLEGVSRNGVEADWPDGWCVLCAGCGAVSSFSHHLRTVTKIDGRGMLNLLQMFRGGFE